MEGQRPVLRPWALRCSPSLEAPWGSCLRPQEVHSWGPAGPGDSLAPGRVSLVGRQVGLPQAIITKAQSRGSSITPHTAPFLGRSRLLRCRQLGRRGSCSGDVVLFLYTKNWMEMTVSSSSTPRLPTSQGRWCSR